jgi:hypothetical protein
VAGHGPGENPLFSLGCPAGGSRIGWPRTCIRHQYLSCRALSSPRPTAYSTIRAPTATRSPFSTARTWRPCSSACRAARTPATRRRSPATSSSTARTRTTSPARETLPHGRHDHRPALGVAIGVGGRFRPACLASAGSRLVSGHARRGRRIMRRPVRAVRACRQDPDWPGAAPARAAAEIVACRCVVPGWPRYQEDGLRP